MDQSMAALVGVVLGAALTAALGRLRDRAQADRNRQHELQQARRAVYLQANLDVIAAVEVADDFVESWHGHQPDAPGHDHGRLLSAANASLLNVALLGSQSTIETSDDLRRAVRSARNLEFTDNPDEMLAILEQFQKESRPRLDGWQAQLRSDLGVE